jgi:uncharacterized lipoprotein
MKQMTSSTFTGGRMLKKSLSIATAFLLAAGMAACDVDQTQEGQVDLPKYEVEKTQEGNVEAPRFDADAPDVNVKTEEQTVEVPTVETEQKKVEVPNVDVDAPKEK